MGIVFIKKLKRYILFAIQVCLSQILFAQGQAGVWYFGQNAGLDFNVDPSVALLDGSLDTDEGCATVCNVQGDLLFYTDGVTVYNKNHAVMANGNNLDGNASATQSSIIVQQPGSSVRYYIFTVDAWQNNLQNGLRYSIVDLSLNGGDGEVIEKNTVLFNNQVCEKVTAVKHANGSDFWIIMHRWDSRDFYAYQLSATGISTPVISTSGVRHSGDTKTAIGYMKTSTDGSKLAVAIYTQNRVELFDFNTTTGVVSNPIQLNNYDTPYGVEFSPSGDLLYISLFLSGEVFQFDITSNDQATINSTAVLVGSGSWLYGSLQLAPDNRIYLTKQGTSGTTGSLNLDVINDPDIQGVGCNFTADAKNLGGRRSFLGLPNFVTSIFTLSFAYDKNCIGDDTEFTITSELTDISDVTWDFGDGTTLTSNTNPFSVTHQYAATGTYSVTLTVNLISGGTDSVTQDVIIIDGPVANDQTSVVWEDVSGGGSASGIDLTMLEPAVNGSSGITYTWYSDAGLSNLVGDPTNVTVTNGQQFWVEVNNGSCTSIAVVTYTVNALPIAVDQNPEVCEDSNGSGIASNIDLTLLENAITNGNSLSVNWFHDIALSSPVTNPNNRIVTNGEVFYAQVVSGTTPSVATVTYTVRPLPEGNNITIQVWEDSFGSGTASGIDLSSYNGAVGGSNTIVWYSDVNLTNPVINPTNITVSDGDVFYAETSDGTCSNRGSVTFIVRSSPIANDLDIELCEEVAGSGTVSGVDLTALNGAINGGSSSTVTWYIDATRTISVTDPTNVTVSNGDIFYVLVSEGSESNSATVEYTILTLPVANSIVVTEFEDVPGSGVAQAVDLTVHNSAVLGGSTNSLVWYSDATLQALVADPTNQDVTDGDIFYALVNDGSCTNVATLEFNVVDTPVARDVSTQVCEDTEGSGIAVVDLTLLENQINEGNGDAFSWYSDWPTEPTGLPVNPVADASSVSVSNGNRYFAVVDDGTNTNVAVATYTVTQLPIANSVTVDVWEDTFGSGTATGISLLNYNSQINSLISNVSWFLDAGLTNAVLTPDNITVTDGDVYYALVDNGNCTNSGVLTFNMRPLPEANNLQIELCEDTQGGAQVIGYDLVQLETAINNDPGTSIGWYFDNALSLPVSNPSSVTINNSSIFYANVSFGAESNVGTVEFTINPLPVVSNYLVELCESSENSGVVLGEDLAAYESEIYSGTTANIIWYLDAQLNNPVVNAGNVQVSNGDVFYARVWDGSCENIAELSYNVIPLPQINEVDKVYCEDDFGTGQVTGIDLTSLQNELTSGSGITIQWFEDDQLSIPVVDPSNVTIINQGNYYALITDPNSCENKGVIHFQISSQPEANDLIIELCEDAGSNLKVEDYNLNTLNNQISGTVGANVEWFSDVDLLDQINNPERYDITNGLSLFAKVEFAGCINSSEVRFVVNEIPKFDLGRDTTIFYTESKVLAPAIDIKFLPGIYLWQDGSTGSTFIVAEEGKYTLEFTDPNNCIGKDSIMVYVDRYRIFVPNAFTPDGDGINDLFGPVITGDLTGEHIEMFIYNRWGELIYEFTDFGNGWDGTYKGKLANTGVYVWVLIVNGKAKKDGTVSLIR